LSDRKFFVSHNNSHSAVLNLEVGCVQGSVLGPVLFNMYLSDISNHIPNATIFTYADDSYINITTTCQSEAIRMAENTISSHIDYLHQKGMVVNHQKTELIYFSTKHQPQIEISVGNSVIKSQNSIKALGITIDKDLSWNPHVNNTAKKVASLMSGLRIVTKHLNKEQAIRIITSQVFPVIYYAAPVWLTTELNYKNLKRVETFHYSTLRIGIKDFKKNVSRNTIDKLTNRMPPRTSMRYSSAGTAIKIIRDNLPSKLHHKIMLNSYQQRRRPNCIYTYDSSHNKHGRRGFHNWINFVLKEIKFPWFNLTRPISNDSLRIQLKKTFSF